MAGEYLTKKQIIRRIVATGVEREKVIAAIDHIETQCEIAAKAAGTYGTIYLPRRIFMPMVGGDDTSDLRRGVPAYVLTTMLRVVLSAPEADLGFVEILRRTCAAITTDMETCNSPEGRRMTAPLHRNRHDDLPLSVVRALAALTWYIGWDQRAKEAIEIMHRKTALGQKLHAEAEAYANDPTALENRVKNIPRYQYVYLREQLIDLMEEDGIAKADIEAAMDYIERKYVDATRAQRESEAARKQLRLFRDDEAFRHFRDGMLIHLDDSGEPRIDDGYVLAEMVKFTISIMDQNLGFTDILIGTLMGIRGMIEEAIGGGKMDRDRRWEFVGALCSIRRINDYACQSSYISDQIESIRTSMHERTSNLDAHASSPERIAEERTRQLAAEAKINAWIVALAQFAGVPGITHENVAENRTSLVDSCLSRGDIGMYTLFMNPPGLLYPEIQSEQYTMAEIVPILRRYIRMLQQNCFEPLKYAILYLGACKRVLDLAEDAHKDDADLVGAIRMLRSDVEKHLSTLSRIAQKQTKPDRLTAPKQPPVRAPWHDRRKLKC